MEEQKEYCVRAAMTSGSSRKWSDGNAVVISWRIELYRLGCIEKGGEVHEVVEVSGVVMRRAKHLSR